MIVISLFASTLFLGGTSAALTQTVENEVDYVGNACNFLRSEEHTSELQSH